ncbi:MAG: AraC family transcriptional regulator [Burkholderiales bacterium]|nr:AraC family transcriptional regulator [Burkholderiales bacterium]
MPESLVPTLVDAALRGTLVALLSLLALVSWRDRPGLPSVRTGALLMLGLCVQVFGAMPLVESGMPGPWQVPLVAVSVGNAVLFWLFVRCLFDDGFAPRPVHALLWLAVAGLAGWNCLVLPHSASVLAPVLRGAQRAIPLVFALLSAQAAVANWHADLVEGRRRLRAVILVGGIVYSVVQAALRIQSADGRLAPGSALLDVSLLLVVVVAAATHMLQLARSDLFPLVAPGPAGARAPAPSGTPATPTPPAMAAPPDTPPAAPTEPPEPAAAPDPAEDRLAEALLRLMSQERAYRSEDLSVASLAAQLRVPEYRLRRLINGRLGHRNFTAFVNGFRLEEARNALADPAQREVPVLTIALDAGFQSIGPFNRAFKAATGLTPTEFRRLRLADS